MSKTEEYKSLIRRFYGNKATDNDIARIQALIEDDIFHDAWEEIWAEQPTDIPSTKSTENKENLFERIIHEVRERPEDERKAMPPLKRHKPMWKYVGLAASVVLTAAIIFFAYRDREAHEKKKETFIFTDTTERVLPGKEQAMIVMDDGSTIDLETLPADTSLHMDGFVIHKDHDGLISYQIDDRRKNKHQSTFNSIITPRGGEYTLQLADGTKVWLNAATTLRYPVTFIGKERTVEIDGEAYFEVRKAKCNGIRMPFIVKTGKQRLEVLGTTFNVNSYGNHVVTTLVEGSVKLSFGNVGITDKTLSSNDQARFNKKKNRYSSRKVDPLYITSWKDGNFAFSNASIQDVMDEIVRWYDVEVIYRKDLNNVRFSGSISRYAQIDKILELIALAGEVDFKREGRRVYVLNQ